MNTLDRYIQRRRVDAALPWIPAGAHVLDVGCADGALFRLGASRIGSGVGVDSRDDGEEWVDGPYERRTGRFPDVIRADERFDTIVMLAVVEHVHDAELKEWAAAVERLLVPNGRLVVTTPSPVVDHLLAIGIRLRLLDGMEAHEHHGFDPREVPTIFSSDRLRLERWRRFELGLNHLFVFTATPQR